MGLFCELNVGETASVCGRRVVRGHGSRWGGWWDSGGAGHPLWEEGGRAAGVPRISGGPGPRPTRAGKPRWLYLPGTIRIRSLLPRLRWPQPGGPSPGCPSPQVCPACPHPLLNPGGTGNLLRHKVDLVTLCSRLPSVINPNSFPSDDCPGASHREAPTGFLPRLPHITSVKVTQVVREWDAI